MANVRGDPVRQSLGIVEVSKGNNNVVDKAVLVKIRLTYFSVH